ncbi:hypothetical protein [Caulobacter sp. 17J65-9]|uniref:hypothetical protein n=1 Tax=Caulobacter sp. 17J65-9 TaxID=2709382 RepID=UPI0013C8D5FE|nr:hypothetical protein [Caulobacter sp. 17J65-9]NEX92352.1 hypothetical protein [Caulobacter sp. 17J65-9]
MPARKWIWGGVAVGFGVFLAWQIVVQAALQVSEPTTALRLAPHSGNALARVAEAELAAGHPAAAERLARQALLVGPHNVRAIRVLGISREQLGDPEVADELVTAAGNMSLRDGPAHTWLVEKRLKQGEYRSALAHADAVMRRKPQTWPAYFTLLHALIKEEPRFLPALAERLAPNPRWRKRYLASLNGEPEGMTSTIALAIMLQGSEHPFSDEEMSTLLSRLVQEGHFKAVATFRQQIPSLGPVANIRDGAFEGSSGPAPIRWQFELGEGALVEILPDETRPNQTALRVEYDGFASHGLVSQYESLPPGQYTLEGQWRSETPVPKDRIAWALTCAGGKQVVLAKSSPSPAAEPVEAWQAFSIDFEVPDSDCEGQWLRLSPQPGSRRNTVVVWYDGLRIRPSKGRAQ